MEGILACPRCRGAMTPAESALRCAGCGARYAVVEGVPDLLPWSGGSPGREWDRWREKLERLQDWRRATWTGSAAAGARQRQADDLAAVFFAFARIPEGARVLEIGCGAADLRRFLPGRSYVGVDPMPLPSKDGAALVRGVGERLPVTEGAFDAVLLCETLDHALDPACVLGEARRALRAGGVLAIQQSVRVEAARAPLPVRLRVAGGRLRARLAGTLPPEEAQTKMHVFTLETLRALTEAQLVVDAAAEQHGTALLRAIKGER
jgi:SAM-dependent methyltransferase